MQIYKKKVFHDGFRNFKRLHSKYKYLTLPLKQAYSYDFESDYGNYTYGPYDDYVNFNSSCFTRPIKNCKFNLAVYHLQLKTHLFIKYTPTF
jgi:hypothetical protein